MLTLKFGGTSMGDAARILCSADIIAERAGRDRLSVVVSAAAGVSNRLQAGIDSCVAGAAAGECVSDLRVRHSEICAAIHERLPGFDPAAVMKRLEPRLEECGRLLTGCAAFGECPDTAHCRIMGTGELLSAPVMEAVLRAKGLDCELLDSRDFIFTTGCQTEGDPDYVRSAEAFGPFRDGGPRASARVLLFPGFVCSWTGGEGRRPVAGLLGRNGSDFSAAIAGACLGSSRVEFWTDVDGVYTADPRIVRDAVVVDNLSYSEAMELAFFGSRVFHPKTLAPLAENGIEAWSLNSQNPSARGTRIARGPFTAERKNPVCGISCLKHVSMVSVSGTGMKGRHGTAGRIFTAVSLARISVLLITQSSSEYTISFCVRDSEAARVQDALASEFSLEIREKLIDAVDVRRDCAVVSVVGDGMIENRGIAARFFDAIAYQDVNILAIAQGSSERCISCVVEGRYGDTAVRAAHRFFFRTAQTVELFIFGAGTIGGALIDQIRDQQKKLVAEKVDLKVMAIARGSGMIVSADGLCLDGWRTELDGADAEPSVDRIIGFVRENRPLNPVFVDCTASRDLPERYLDILKAGMSVVTPNKRANSMRLDFYHELRRTANRMHRRFLYETNVGAGLPIIDTLQNLFKSGDRLTGFSGIMSGSLSYIFGRLDEDVPFSRAVMEARDLGYTEPDPRDDLNGMDVARKALIIAREAGYRIELEDIRIDRVFPDSFDTGGTPEEFMARLPQIDGYFAEKTAALKKRGMALRMGASIKDGVCAVGMLEVGSSDPLYAVRGGENAFVFHTERYNPIPLTVRGYGAGAAVTAAGVFGDILRTVSFNPENR